MERLNAQRIRREEIDCRSCHKKRGTSQTWCCCDCYEEIQRKIKELETKVFFLTVDDHDQFPADVYLIVEDDSEGSRSTRIPAHRFILASRSPVFKAMFEHPMEENQNGEIIIKEASFKALKVFVKYFYSASFLNENEELASLASQVFVLADKYQVMELKNHCEDFLVSNLTWENSMASYAFAHLHNAKLLLEAATSLITNNLDKLRIHPHYRGLADDNPALVVQMLEASLVAQAERNATSSTSA